MPDKIPMWIRKRALEMYNELLENRQEIVLIPAPEPVHSSHFIRVVQNKPPEWFSKFVNQFPKSSKKYPRIRPRVYRREVINALKKLSDGKNCSINTFRLKKFIENEVPF